MSDREVKIFEVLTLVDPATIDAENQQCAICFDLYEEHVQESSTRTKVTAVARLQCGHLFGQECISEWLRDKETCPKCRALILAHPNSLEDSPEDLTRWYHLYNDIVDRLSASSHEASLEAFYFVDSFLCWHEIPPRYKEYVATSLAGMPELLTEPRYETARYYDHRMRTRQHVSLESMAGMIARDLAGPAYASTGL